MKSLQDVPIDKHVGDRFGQLGKLEAVGRLAGGVAHDFNNLLTVILGCTELLLHKPRGPEETRTLLEEIAKAGEKASALTRQLLLFSRRQDVQPVVLNANDLVSDFAKMLRRLINENIQLKMSLEPRLHHVKGDPGKLEQVLLNLVVNARDAMPKGGELRIETANVTMQAADLEDGSVIPPGSYATLVVRDTGCGMAPEILDHLFEPFFTTKEPGKGTGLGLATVYGIVKQSGGHIRVASKPGVGTRFRIYLPAVQDPVSKRAAPKDCLQESPRQETILLVEDDRAVRSMAEMALRQSGFSILLASDGLNALSLSDRHTGPIDLVLTDVIMPLMTGPELAKEMSRRRPNTKVLFMSGYTDSLLALHDEEENVRSSLLEKPFTPAELVGAVRKAFAC